MRVRSPFLPTAGLLCLMLLAPANAAEQLSREAQSTAAVRVVSSAEMKQLRKYCGKRANREDLRCVQLARLDGSQGKSGGISPWLIAVPIGLAAGIGAAAAGGGGAPASP